MLVLCREIRGLKTLLNKTKNGEEVLEISEVNGKIFPVFIGWETWIHGHKAEEGKIHGYVKLETSCTRKKTLKSHTTHSKLPVSSSMLQKHEVKEGKLQEFPLLILIFEQLELSVQM